MSPPAETESVATTEIAPRIRQAVPRLALGLVVAAVALWLAFRDTDLAALRQGLAHLDYGLTATALLLVIATLLVVTLRWRLLFYPDHRSRSWRPLLRGVLIGQFLNIMLPIRLGEVVRAQSVAAAEKLPVARVLATIAVEKLTDVVALASATVVLLAALSLPAWLQEPGRALVLTGLTAGAIIALLSRWDDAVLRWVSKGAGWLPARPRAWLVEKVSQGQEGLGALREWRTSLLLWALSVGILLLSALTNYLLFLAFDLSLPPVAAVFLLVVLSVGASAVSVPGNLGVFHYLTVLALAVFSVDRDTALAYAVALYVVALMPKIVLGAVVLAVGIQGESPLGRRGC